MPGIQITYMFRPDPRRRESSHPNVVNPHAAAGEPAVRLHADSHVVIDAEWPKWYPLEQLEDSETLQYLEGHVYGGGRSSLLQSLRTLDPPAEDDALASQLRKCADRVDGDFLLVWYEQQSSRLCVVGDRFGRLPVYYTSTDEEVVVARQQSVLLSRIVGPSVDPTALAQLLLLGYPLRNRTLVSGVRRLLPGEALVVSPRGTRNVLAAASPFRIQSPLANRGNLKRHVRELCDVFISACRDRRIPGRHDVLSLSGGFDSRAAAGGMRAAGGSFSAVTFAAPGSPHGDERETAAGVARAVGADWRGYQLDHTDPRWMWAIIRLQLGLSPIDVAFGLEYVDRVQRDFPGPVSFWTGEGVDKVLCDHPAIPRYPDTEELVAFIIAKSAVWEPRDVETLIGVRQHDLESSIHSAVATCKDAEDGYAHFLLSERVVRWYYEGEERHRNAVWPIAPFLAHEFVSLARAIPREHKMGRRLYRAFLRTLAPDLASLPLSGGSSAPGSVQYAVKHALRDRLRNNRQVFRAYRRLRRRRASRTLHGDLWLRHLRSYQQGRPVPAPFDQQVVERIASGQPRHPSGALSVLLTAMAAAEAIQGDLSGPFATAEAR